MGPSSRRWSDSTGITDILTGGRTQAEDASPSPAQLRPRSRHTPRRRAAAALSARASGRVDTAVLRALAAEDAPPRVVGIARRPPAANQEPYVGAEWRSVDPKGIVGTAQRIGSAIGIALIAAILFGTLDFGDDPDAALHAFAHSATSAMGVSTTLAIAAFALVFTLPRKTRGWDPTGEPCRRAVAATRLNRVPINRIAANSLDNGGVSPGFSLMVE